MDDYNRIIDNLFNKFYEYVVNIRPKKKKKIYNPETFRKYKKIINDTKKKINIKVIDWKFKVNFANKPSFRELWLEFIFLKLNKDNSKLEKKYSN